MSQQKETERVREIFDASAAHYDKGMAFSEKFFFGDGRAWACSQARGQVLEIAIGTGLNLSFYPADVEITGIEISPAMLEIARQRAQSLGRQVELVVGDAQALPFPDQRFDTVVCTISLCSIPDERQAVAEVWRVLVDASLPSNMCAVQTSSYADLRAGSNPTRCVLRQITFYVSQ
jgi:ubiquinone/menaquinone biosynthesis C-methylase UbiE